MLRTMEIGGNWSGPAVGQYLRALGCEVIRLESPKHRDPVRMLPAPRDQGRRIEDVTADDNPYFHQVNAGKLSVELDLSDPDQLEHARQLAATCDAVVENLSPGAIDRMGMGFAALSSLRPSICMLSLPTLHRGDPHEGLRGFAPVFTGLGGLEAQVGYDDEITGMLSTGWGDPVGAVTGLLGLLAALANARHTGLGAHVVTSQLKSVTWQLIEPFMAFSGFEGSQEADIETRVLPTADGDEWVVCAGASALWRELLDARPEPEDLAGWSQHLPVDDLLAALASAGIEAAPVRRVEQVADGDRMRGRGVVEGYSAGPLGTIPRYHVPWLIDGAAPRVEGAGPQIGEHTQDVFRSLENGRIT